MLPGTGLLLATPPALRVYTRVATSTNQRETETVGASYDGQEDESDLEK